MSILDTSVYHQVKSNLNLFFYLPTALWIQSLARVWIQDPGPDSLVVHQNKQLHWKEQNQRETVRAIPSCTQHNEVSFEVSRCQWECHHPERTSYSHFLIANGKIDLTFLLKWTCSAWILNFHFRHFLRHRYSHDHFLRCSCHYFLSLVMTTRDPTPWVLDSHI